MFSLVVTFSMSVLRPNGHKHGVNLFQIWPVARALWLYSWQTDNTIPGYPVLTNQRWNVMVKKRNKCASWFLMPLTGAIHIKSDSYNGEKIDLPLQNEEIKWNHHRASTQTHEC